MRNGAGANDAGRGGNSVVTRIMSSASRFANKNGIYMGKRSTKVHVALYQRSNGRIGGHLPGSPKAKVLLLDHVGAKSGLRRTSPLMYYAGDNFVAVVASKAGQPTHPAWFHNLKANPDTTIRIGSETRPVRARVATDAERAQLWPEFVAFFPDYDFYQHLARDRKIPIMILDPR